MMHRSNRFCIKYTKHPAGSLVSHEKSNRVRINLVRNWNVSYADPA